MTTKTKQCPAAARTHNEEQQDRTRLRTYYLFDQTKTLTEQDPDVDHDVCERHQLPSDVRGRDLRDVHGGHNEPAPHPQPRQEPPRQELGVRHRQRHAPGPRDENAARYRDGRLPA